MGVVYGLSEVSSGRVPDASDLLDARDYYFGALTDPEAPTQNNIRLLILGSVATSQIIAGKVVGPVTRRSDLDRLIVIDSFQDEADPAQALAKVEEKRRYIQSVEDETTAKYHVKFEGKLFTEGEILQYGPAIGEPLWTSHCMDMQKNSQWSYREPFSDFKIRTRNADDVLNDVAVAGLWRSAIDVTDQTRLQNPEVRSNLATTILDYYSHKELLFAGAGEPDFKLEAVLHRMQRALEFGKAATRKALGISALIGDIVTEGVDVTSKVSMREQAELLLDHADLSERSKQMKNAMDVTDGLDREYDEVLEEALQTGAVGNYEQWLHANYLPACAAALFLSRGYYEWANDLTWNDPTITIEKFHEVDNTMEDSGGEALPLHSNNEAPPILVNLELGEVYELATYQADANQIVAA